MSVRNEGRWYKPKDQDGNDQGKGPPPSAGGRNVEVDFRKQTRSNETHESTTDREARLYRMGPGIELLPLMTRHGSVSGAAASTALSK